MTESVSYEVTVLLKLLPPSNAALKQPEAGSHHQWSSLMSSKLVGPRMRHRVQTDGAQVPSGRGLCCCGRLRAWRSRSTTALLLHNWKHRDKGVGLIVDMP